MTILEFDVDVECGECGAILSAHAVRSRYNNVTIVAAPCSACLAAANSDGYREDKDEE